VPNNDRVSNLTSTSTNYTLGRSSIFEMLTDRSRVSNARDLLRQSSSNLFGRAMTTNSDDSRISTVMNTFSMQRTPTAREAPLISSLL